MAGWKSALLTSLAVNNRLRLADTEPRGFSRALHGPLDLQPPLVARAHRSVYRSSVSDAERPDEQIDQEVAYLRATPVDELLGNHLFVLLQLGALRLSETPPQLEAAQLVIDVVGAMLTAGDTRLGEHVALYRNALAELQQAYVRALNAERISPRGEGQ